MWKGLFGTLTWHQAQVCMIGMAAGAASGAVAGRQTRHTMQTRYTQRRYMGIGGMIGLAGAIAYLYVNR